MEKIWILVLISLVKWDVILAQMTVKVRQIIEKA
jgi:hypothetical protein